MSTNTGGIAGEQLRAFIERIERLEEERKGIAEDVKEIYAGAKATGFDPAVIRKVISLRKMDQAERQEAEALLDVYLHAVEGGSEEPLYPDQNTPSDGNPVRTYNVEGVDYTYDQLKSSNWTDEQIAALA